MEILRKIEESEMEDRIWRISELHVVEDALLCSYSKRKIVLNINKNSEAEVFVPGDVTIATGRTTREKVWTNKASLEKHLRTVCTEKHLGNSLKICEVCDYRTHIQGDMDRHKRTHTLEKPFKCSFCEKSFRYKCDRKKHECIHTGRRDFKCDVCDKAFVTSGHLTRHVRIHNNEKPHKCAVCSRAFGQRVSLAKHMRRIHADTNYLDFECKICDISFVTKSELSKHCRTARHMETERKRGASDEHVE